VDDDTMCQQITEFIQGRFPSLIIAPDDDIFALGFVNSLFAMEIVLFLENTYAFSVPNEELNLDNFRTVMAMAALVQRHAGVVAGPSQL
jgi:methoxymalonate biosynthesis acyl carrier protein